MRQLQMIGSNPVLIYEVVTNVRQGHSANKIWGTYKWLAVTKFWEGKEWLQMPGSDPMPIRHEAVINDWEWPSTDKTWSVY